MPFLILLVIFSVAHSIELPDRCELKYRKCMFDCVQEFPLDKKRRSGCETRCKVNKGWCKAGKVVKDIAEDINRFLEGFSGDK